MVSRRDAAFNGTSKVSVKVSSIPVLSDDNQSLCRAVTRRLRRIAGQGVNEADVGSGETRSSQGQNRRES
jgi:hypothetical protein